MNMARCRASDGLLSDDLVRPDELVHCPICGELVRAIPQTSGRQLVTRIAAHAQPPPQDSVPPPDPPSVPSPPQPAGRAVAAQGPPPAPELGSPRGAAGPAGPPSPRPAPLPQPATAAAQQARVATAETPIVPAPPRPLPSFDASPKYRRGPTP